MAFVVERNRRERFIHPLDGRRNTAIRADCQYRFAFIPGKKASELLSPQKLGWTNWISTVLW